MRPFDSLVVSVYLPKETKGLQHKYEFRFALSNTSLYCILCISPRKPNLAMHGMKVSF